MDIQYKGFIGKIFFSANASSFCGEVLNSDDLIAFQAPNTEAAIEAMQDAIDRYLRYSVPDSTVQFKKT